MSDDLDRIRQARMRELQNKSQSPQPQEQAEHQAQASAQEEARHAFLSKILEPEARERLSRIEIVRPERARQVEEVLFRMVRSQQLRGKVGEQDLVRLLDQISQHDGQNRPQVVYSRHDSDDDLELDAPAGLPVDKASDDDDDDFFD